VRRRLKALVCAAVAGVLAFVTAAACGSGEGKPSHRAATVGDVPVTVAHGATVRLAGGATLVIPPRAVSADGRLIAHTGGPQVGTNLGLDGRPGAAKPVFASAGSPITFELTGAKLVHPAALSAQVNAAAFAQAGSTAKRPGAVWLAFYDAAGHRWQHVDSRYDPVTHSVTAQVTHLSTWNPFTWDWAGMTLRLRQSLSALGSGRAPTTACPSPKVQGVDVTMAGGNDPPLIGCVSGDATSGLKVDITDNRAYSMVLQVSPATVQEPRDYAGFEEYVQSRDLVAKAIGGAYLASVGTVAYRLPPTGTTFRFTGAASLNTAVLDLGIVVSEAFFDTVTFGYAKCVLDNVAHSGAASLGEAPGLIAECLPGLGLVVELVGDLQDFQSKVANVLSGYDLALDTALKVHGEVDITRPKDWYNTSYTSTCGGNALQPFTVNVQNGKGTSPGSPQHYYVQVEAVKHGDLTGDGRPETAVLLYCTLQPSNFYVEDVQIFGPASNLLAELPHGGTFTPPGSPLPPQYIPSELSISAGQLIAGMKFYAPTDSHASGPSVHRTLTWRWNGNQFVLLGGGVGSVSPTADVLALLQKLAMQKCQSDPSHASECTPGGAKVSRVDPRYGVGIADATGGHGTIFMRPSTSSTAFAPVMSIGGDLPSCSQVQAAGVPGAVFKELLEQPCLNT
jgi:hypothetical protein